MFNNYFMYFIQKHIFKNFIVYFNFIKWFKLLNAELTSEKIFCTKFLLFQLGSLYIILVLKYISFKFVIVKVLNIFKTFF